MKPKLEDEAMELMRVGTGVRSKDMRREGNRISVQTNQVWFPPRSSRPARPAAGAGR